MVHKAIDYYLMYACAQNFTPKAIHLGHKTYERLKQEMDTTGMQRAIVIATNTPLYNGIEITIHHAREHFIGIT